MDIMKQQENSAALQQDQTYINMSVAEQLVQRGRSFAERHPANSTKRMAINNEAARKTAARSLSSNTTKNLREFTGRVMEQAHGGVSGGKGPV